MMITISLEIVTTIVIVNVSANLSLCRVCMDVCRWNENGELYLLLLLWLLLYCFWLLPQMDLKTLPSLLLNLDH